MEQFVKNTYGNYYFNAAHLLGYDINIYSYDHSYGEIINKDKSLLIYNNNLSINSMVNRRISIDKYLTSQLLNISKHKIAPIAYIIRTNKDINENMHKIETLLKKSPLVVKPNRGSLGEDVTVKIKTKEELLSAINAILSKSKSVLVEEFVDGDDYRFVSYDGEIIDVIKRIPAYIIGDGVSTIKNLIDKKNTIRSTQNLNKIKLDSDLSSRLESMSLSLESTLQDGQRLQLTDICNLSLGGEVERIDLTSLHPSYTDIIKLVHDRLKIKFLGVDIITTDITKDFISGGAKINEVNSAPHMSLSQVADIAEGKSLKTIKLLIQRVFTT